MKIQAVNNTNFKGLFLDKTRENNNNWRMEYYPYSWESNNTSKMERKEKIDLTADKLPNNEEIYTETNTFEKNSLKRSEDILGTVSYWEKGNGEMRRTITEMPAFDRLTSLNVYRTKMNVFRSMQERNLTKLGESFNSIHDNARVWNARIADKAAKFFPSSSDLIYYGQKLGDCEQEMNTNIRKFLSILNGYTKGKNHMENIREEIEALENAKKNGKLIDISRRDIADRNRPLYEALYRFQGREIPEDFIVALANKSIKLRNLVKSSKEWIRNSAGEAGRNFIESVVQDAEKYMHV